MLKGLAQCLALSKGSLYGSAHCSVCHCRKNYHLVCSWVFSGGSDSKESACQSRRRGFDPWIGKIPWRGKWQSTPVFSPGKSHGQMSLEGYSPWGRKRIGHDLVTKQEQNRSKKFADLGVSQS